MTKKRISPVPHTEPIRVKVPTNAGDLPTPAEINSAANLVTETKRRAEDGRPKKEGAEGRVTYNTRIKSDLLEELKIRAIRKRMTTADLLEEIISKYLSE